MAVAYDWHNYGKPTIGDRTDIEGVPIDHLQALLPHLLPARQRVADRRREDSTKPRARRWCSKHFGAIPRPARDPAGTSTPRADAGRRAPRGPAPRGRRADRRGRRTTFRRRVPEDCRDCRSSVRYSRRAGWAAAQALVATGKAAAVCSAALMLAEPGMFGFGVQVRKPAIRSTRHSISSSRSSKSRPPNP